MPSKDIVCLAYSRKLGGRCFAGIDIATGQWIRATGRHANGALSDFDCHMVVANDPYTIPKPLDVIRIDFDGPEPGLAQPENWKTSGTEWKKLRQANSADLGILRRSASDDPELFRGYERYVSSQDIQTRPPACSLALVRPSKLHWQAKKDQYGRDGFRGQLTVSGVPYDLPLTCDEYASRLARGDEGKLIDGLADTSMEIFLAVSLGDLFAETGRYYKLIAGVIEIPQIGI
jgi:hypothetical protein